MAGGRGFKATRRKRDSAVPSIASMPESTRDDCQKMFI
ncbi:hypothetical protein CNECB9_3280006 [Cupriavidus necator]|uniref:Uncharacterized protein n=1 Tax=Cupriavidus necator TaxID=106590 RepID=A0A1K0IH00_CUPNE|nr:hypothetical protein CNECB9_3280006 [Cupriavidus necator]